MIHLEVSDYLGKKTYSKSHRSQYRKSDIPENMKYVLSVPNPAPMTIKH
ncbi:hypothetical protein VIBNISFn118_120009 [Vibrio nigripulchritudo SFn118]|nr:hypothetical protein VIBNISFn118_120009 [Vibrio nigripulchritudo SFn118]